MIDCNLIRDDWQGEMVRVKRNASFINSVKIFEVNREVRARFFYKARVGDDFEMNVAQRVSYSPAVFKLFEKIFSRTPSESLKHAARIIGFVEPVRAELLPVNREPCGVQVV